MTRIENVSPYLLYTKELYSNSFLLYTVLRRDSYTLSEKKLLFLNPVR